MGILQTRVRASVFCIAVIQMCAAICQPVYGRSDLQIVVPNGGFVAVPGQSLTVSVSGSASYLQVTIITTDPIGFSLPSSTTPYQIVVNIPANTPPGLYSMTAVGLLGPSRVAESDAVTLTASAIPDFTGIMAVKPIRMNLAVGDQKAIQVIDTSSGGSIHDLSNNPANTYVSSSPVIATVQSNELVTAVGIGIASILVNGTYNIPVRVGSGLGIVPLSVHVESGGRVQFFSHYSNPGGGHVSWSLNAGAPGAIDGNGLYSAPASVPQAQTVAGASQQRGAATLSEHNHKCDGAPPRFCRS